MAVSVDDREWAIFRASLDSGRWGSLGRVGLVSEVVIDEIAGAEAEAGAGAGADSFGLMLSGELSLLNLMERTAASSASNFRASPLERGESSSLELTADSGGEITAPGGMMACFTGGGDWRRLACGSMEAGVSGAECTVVLLIEGLLR